MKGLVLKDFYVLSRQMRSFFVLIVIFSLLPGSNMTIFAVIYAAMLPYTALAYDERAKWDQLAGMMPYSTRQLVLSKYILGWIASGATSLLALLAGVVERGLGIGQASEPSMALLAFCVGTLMMSITLPLMFRLGVERGRMFFVILMVVIACGSAGLLSGLAEEDGVQPLMALLTLVLPLAAVLLSAVSILVSIRLYSRRER